MSRGQKKDQTDRISHVCELKRIVGRHEKELTDRSRAPNGQQAVAVSRGHDNGRVEEKKRGRINIVPEYPLQERGDADNGGRNGYLAQTYRFHFTLRLTQAGGV